MNFTAPKFNLKAFHCPLCGTYAHMKWEKLHSSIHNYSTFYHEATCSKCEEPSLWRVSEYTNNQIGRLDKNAELIYPDNGAVALPEKDMPEDVRVDYIEASRIF